MTAGLVYFPGAVLCAAGWGFRPESLLGLASHLPTDAAVRFTSAAACGAEPDPAAAMAREIRACAEPPLLVGWSMGGMLALEALSAGAPVAGLVLIGCTPRFCEDGDYLCGTPVPAVRAMRAAARKDPAGLARDFAAACAATAGSAAGLATLTDVDTPRMTRGLDYLLAADLRERLSGINVPTLLLHGKADRIVPVNAARELHRRITGSELVRLEGHAHDLPVTAARLVAGHIREFASRRLGG